MKSFFRQRSRVVGAVLTPVFLWLMLGMGMGRSFEATGVGSGFLEYFYPGIVVFAVVFAGMYSTISTIQDRQAGFLQSVLVAPIPRSSLVIGKMLGGTLIALVQGVLLLVLTPLSGIGVSVTGLLSAVVVLALIAFAMTGLGFVFAWKIDSVQGYHAIMNLILMPLWMLSGAFFPGDGAASWVQWVMKLNPLTYGLAALRHVFYLDNATMRATLPDLFVSVAVIAGCGLLCFVWASRTVAKRPAGAR